MQLRLQYQIGTQPYTYTLTDAKTILIGRKRDCDIVLRNKTVSRQHAEVSVKDGMFHLHNLSQANPIPIYTGQTLARGEMMPLQSGYALQLGFRKLRIQSIQTRSTQRILKLAGQNKDYTVIAERPVIIGRKKDCDIVLSNTTVSRRHALIFAKSDDFHLLNLSQSSDIYVNTRQKLMPGQALVLRAGDIFRLGLIKIRLQPVESSEKPPESASLFKIQCPGCERKLNPTLKDCPWCGVSLACGMTVQ